MLNLKKVIERSRLIYIFLFVIITAIGGVSYYAISNSSSLFTQYREMAIDSNVAKALLNDLMFLRLKVKNCIQYGTEDSKDQFYKRLVGVNESIQKAEAAIQNPERSRLLAESKDLFSKYQDHFAELVELTSDKRDLIDSFEEKHKKINEVLRKATFASEADKNLALANYWQFYIELNKKKDSYETVGEEKLMEFKGLAYAASPTNPSIRKMLEDDYRDVTLRLNQIVNKNIEIKASVEQGLDRIGPIIAKNLKSISDSIQKVQDTLGPKLVATNETSQALVLIMGIVGLLFAIGSVYFVNRNMKTITSHILRLVNKLNRNTVQVTSISERTAASSKSVSESSHEQAVSIEETSSSIEEMDGMAKKNLESVAEATRLTSDMKTVAEKANQQMSDLVDSMSQIAKSNQRIEDLSSVISEIERKTRLIDEIVSQTKILSFNASVEAERAGEHGKGFAVVAEEVGNLAKTSGDAAKEIQEIVAKSLKEVEGIITTNRERVEEGARITDGSKQVLEEIDSTCRQVLSKNEEVLNSTNEQFQGIKQINIAVSELDKATQDNSHVAQETTVVAEELEGQALDLASIVKNLNQLLGKDASDEETADLAESTGDSVQAAQRSKKNLSFSASPKGRVGNVHQLSQASSQTAANEPAHHQESEPQTFKKAANDPWDEI
ncbi:MAG: hypothetical protein HRT45_15750 [Bdellovibrionales bacterium]|nr:hypothetical protein [Bdellovibrionales bacterium]